VSTHNGTCSEGQLFGSRSIEEGDCHGEGLVDYGKRKRVGAVHRRGGVGRRRQRRAGARRTEELASLLAQYGERVKPVTLEVREEAAAKATVQIAMDTFGRLDVLVNNAGYGPCAPFEQMRAEDFQAVVDTCFYGGVYTTRAALPVMRKQRSGHIFQVSSIGGRLAFAGNTPYHAAKWAVGGFSDAVAMEVEPFGVKICTLEPGGIRTNYARRALQNAPDLLPDYEARSVRHSSCCEAAKGVQKAIRGRLPT
jgi:NAD(P)-dependent dehydrogenase (short-subunit alcohol dehydrogenase family)